MPTYQTYAAKGLRESLADIISNVSPEETPIYSAIGRGKARATFEEWQTDTLGAANAANAVVEGADATYAAPTATTRLGNYTQISVKDFMISSTLDAVNKAGRKSEIAYQTIKQGKELRTDIEAAISQNSAAVAGNSTTARRSAGLETFAWAVNSHGTGTPNGSTTVVTAGAPTTAPVDSGTTRTFTEALFKTVIASGFNVGARYKTAFMPIGQKQVFSGFAGVPSTRLSVNQARRGQGVVVGAADIYMSDAGDITVVPTPHMRTKTVLLMDPEYVEVRFLDEIQENKDLAKTGLAEKKQIFAEWTLCVKNPRAIAKVADLS